MPGRKFILGRKFVPGRNWGGETDFLLFVYSTHKKLHNEVGLGGNLYSTQGQAALIAVTDVIKETVWFINVYSIDDLILSLK